MIGRALRMRRSGGGKGGHPLPLGGFSSPCKHTRAVEHTEFAGWPRLLEKQHSFEITSQCCKTTSTGSTLSRHGKISSEPTQKRYQSTLERVRKRAHVLCSVYRSQKRC